MGPNLQKTIQPVTQNCMIGAKKNPKTALKLPQRNLRHSNALSCRKFQIPASVCDHFFRIGGSISHLDRKSLKSAVTESDLTACHLKINT